MPQQHAHALTNIAKPFSREGGGAGAEGSGIRERGDCGRAERRYISMRKQEREQV